MDDPKAPIRILCVDDNPHVADALKVKFGRSPAFEWAGWSASADALVDTVRNARADIVLLDLDMPGADPLNAAEGLRASCPDARVIVFSSHVRADLIDKALEAGAWGYASKHDTEDQLVDVIRSVAAGGVNFTPEVWTAYAKS